MACYEFQDLLSHVGHDIVCVQYGTEPQNVAVECETCSMVLFDLNDNEHYEKVENEKDGNQESTEAQSTEAQSTEAQSTEALDSET